MCCLTNAQDCSDEAWFLCWVGELALIVLLLLIEHQQKRRELWKDLLYLLEVNFIAQISYYYKKLMLMMKKQNE